MGLASHPRTALIDERPGRPAWMEAVPTWLTCHLNASSGSADAEGTQRDQLVENQL